MQLPGKISASLEKGDAARVLAKREAQLSREMSEASEPRQLRSSADERLRRLRGDLVLQLFVRRGPLWEAVREVRDRWNITAKVQLPPPVVGWLLPEGAPECDHSKEYWEYVRQWDEEMSAIRVKVASKPCVTTDDFFDYELKMSWTHFLSACVLCDPPDDQLIEFASYGNLQPTYLSDGRFPPDRGNLKGLPEMVDPPIKSLWGLMEVRDWFWKRVLDHIGERYLESQGMDVETLLEDVLLDVPGLREEHAEKYKQYSTRYYIEVDDFTTLDDVKSAHRMIRSVQKERPKPVKPPRDRLTAVQCALLYVRHNQADLEDKRRKRWTHAKLADHFGLSSPVAARDHISDGKKILEGKDPDAKR